MQVLEYPPAGGVEYAPTVAGKPVEGPRCFCGGSTTVTARGPGGWSDVCGSCGRETVAVLGVELTREEVERRYGKPAL